MGVVEYTDVPKGASVFSAIRVGLRIPSFVPVGCCDCVVDVSAELLHLEQHMIVARIDAHPAKHDAGGLDLAEVGARSRADVDCIPISRRQRKGRSQRVTQTAHTVATCLTQLSQEQY